MTLMAEIDGQPDRGRATHARAAQGGAGKAGGEVVIRNFRRTTPNSKSHDREFEKYRIAQDRLYQSDFDRLLVGHGELDSDAEVQAERRERKSRKRGGDAA